MKEEWRDIRGYEGFYQVSNLGNVRALKKWNTGTHIFEDGVHNLRPTDNGNGYLIVPLLKNKNRKNHYVHRLVAEAFVNNPNNYGVVNHLDYNKGNNVFTNLEWCTQRQNVLYSRDRMCKRRTVATASTGELYISERKLKTHTRYRLTIDRKEIGVFDTLEEAIVRRNEILRGVV